MFIYFIFQFYGLLKIDFNNTCALLLIMSKNNRNNEQI